MKFYDYFHPYNFTLNYICVDNQTDLFVLGYIRNYFVEQCANENMVTSKSLIVCMLYLEAYFSKNGLPEIKQFLGDELKFSGPMYECNSALEYINTLQDNPPENVGYKIMHMFENGDDVCIIYEYMADKISVPVSHYFKVEDRKITSMKLFFDSTPFLQLKKTS